MNFDYKSPIGGMPTFEMPGAIREMAENGLIQARQTYQNFKATAETANGAIEASYAEAAKGAASYQSKLLEIARDNTASVFDFYTKMLSVRSLTEMSEIVTSHAKTQAETMASQSRELTELSKKMAESTMEPFKGLKDTATRAFADATKSFETASEKALEPIV